MSKLPVSGPSLKSRPRHCNPPAPIRPRNDSKSRADATVRRYYLHDRGRFWRPVTQLQRLDGALVVGLGGVRLESERVEFPVKGRAADVQSARDLGHLPPIVGDRKANHLGFQLFERTDLAGRVGERQGSGSY